MDYILSFMKWMYENLHIELKLFMKQLFSLIENQIRQSIALVYFTLSETVDSW